jgi:hypothetical protein
MAWDSDLSQDTVGGFSDRNRGDLRVCVAVGGKLSGSLMATAAGGGGAVGGGYARTRGGGAGQSEDRDASSVEEVPAVSPLNDL